MTYLVDPRDLVQVKAYVESNTSSKLTLSDPETYATRFVEFTAAYDHVSHAGKIVTILQESPNVALLLRQLVPDRVTTEDFWARYFFRTSEIEREEATRKAMVANAAASHSTEDEFAWDSEEEEEESVSEIVPEILQLKVSSPEDSKSPSNDDEDKTAAKEESDKIGIASESISPKEEHITGTRADENSTGSFEVVNEIPTEQIHDDDNKRKSDKDEDSDDWGAWE